MKIEYFARNATIDDQVRRYAEEKLRKLAKFLDDPEEAEARLTLEHEKHHFVAEVQLSHRHGTLVAKETANQLLDAVNLAVDKVETQAERSRKKHKETPRRVVETTKLEIKPMSIEEAALELEDGHRSFVVFRDMDTDRVSVLYKRRDENYGLIAPEL